MPSLEQMEMACRHLVRLCLWNLNPGVLERTPLLKVPVVTRRLPGVQAVTHLMMASLIALWSSGVPNETHQIVAPVEDQYPEPLW